MIDEIEFFKTIHGEIVGAVHILLPGQEEMTQFYYQNGFVYQTLEYSLLDENRSKDLLKIVGSIESIGDVQRINAEKFYEEKFFSDVNVENVYELGQYPSVHIVFRGSECDVDDDIKNTIGYKALEKAIVLLCEDKSSRIFEYPDDLED